MLITDEELKRYSQLDGEEQVQEALNITKKLDGKYGEVIKGYKQILNKTKPKNIEKIRETFITDICDIMGGWNIKKINLNVKQDIKNELMEELDDSFQSETQSLLKQLVTPENPEKTEQQIQYYMKKFEKEEHYVGLAQIYVLNENPKIEEFKTLYQTFSDEDKMERYYDGLPEIETDHDKQKVKDNGIYWFTKFLVKNVSGKVFNNKEVIQMLIEDPKFDNKVLIEKLSEEQQVSNIESIIQVLNETASVYEFARYFNLISEKCQKVPGFQKCILSKMQIYFNNESSEFTLKDIWVNLTEDMQEKFKSTFINYLLEDGFHISFIWPYTKENVQQKMLGDIFKKAEEKYKDNEYGYKSIAKDIWCGLSIKVQDQNEELFWKIYQELKGEFLGVFNFWNETKNQEKYFEKIYQDMLTESDKKSYERKIEIYQIWKATNVELQKKYLEKILQDFPNDKSSLFASTNKKLQDEYFENEKHIGDKQTVDLFMNLDKELKLEKQSLFWTYFNEYIDSDLDLVLKLWTRMDFDEFQNENFKKVYNLLKDRPDGKALFFGATRSSFTQISDENIKYILLDSKGDEEEFINLVKSGFSFNNLVKNAMQIYEEDFEMQIKIWSSITEYQQEKNAEWFNKAIQNHAKNPDDLVRIWYSSGQTIQAENMDVLDYLIEECELTSSEYTKLLNHTTGKILTENWVCELIKKANKEHYNDMLENYKTLEEMNPKINQTLNIDMLRSDIVKILGNDKLIKLTTDIDLQNSIAQNMSNKNFIGILKYVSNNVKNWTLEINEICNNIGEYSELFENIQNQELNENQLKQLYLMLLQEKNWFKIKEIKELENYSKNRKKLCSEILEGKNVDGKMSEEFKNLTENEKKIFAILELSYGIDISTAQNLVYKYGEDIDEIVKGKFKKEEAVQELKVLKSLLELKGNEAEKLYKSNKIKIQNWDDIEYSAGVHIEEKALELYEKLYKDALQCDEEKRESVDYNGTKVPVSEIVGDFNFFIRVEGAYSYWKEPDDFSTYFDDVDPYGNGNCKSFVANNLFARARPKGPTFGYNEVKDNSLLIMAPWDIVSNGANYSFSTSSVKWDFNMGIQFRIPERMIDYTRDNHNEVVSQKWFMNERKQQIERDKPNFVLYVKTKSDINIEEDSQYKMSVKAAAQLGIPLKIIDVEKNIEREQNKIEGYLKALTKENKTKMTEEQIIKKIIVDMENNRVAMRFADEELKQKYFTDNMRENTYDAIIDVISNYEKTNPDRAKSLQLAFENAISDEIEKAYTNTEKTTDFYDEKDFLIYQKSRILNTKNIKKFDLDVYTMKDIKYILNEVSKLKYYDGNKAHSIEHIEKVVLFSALLAEIEGLNKEDEKILLVASAFHDSGRSGLDGNDKHAEASSNQTLKYLEENPNNPFDISKDNIGIIRTAIHYHEYKEKELGKIDVEEIKRIAKMYNVRENDISRTLKICELLKDADALDRFRFANRARLNPDFLRSKSAKSNGMINFAKNVNEAMAEQILIKVYNKRKEELSKTSNVRQLRYARIEANKENLEFNENHLPLDELFDVIGLDSEEIESNIKDNKKTEILMKWYKQYGVTKEDIENITRMFVQRMKGESQNSKQESEIEVR